MPVTMRSWIPSLVIMAVTGLFCGALYLDVQSTQNLAAAFKKTVEIRNELELFISDLKDAETGQRGYLITGDEAYLAPYTAATTEIPQHLDKLLSSTTDDAGFQQKIEQVASLTKQKLEELDGTIRLRREQGFEAAAITVKMGQGKNTMDDIRRSVGDMNDGIEASLAAQRAQSEKNHAPLQMIAVILLAVYWVNALRLERAGMRVGTALRARRASEEKMRLIFETVSQGIVVWLADGGIDAANTSAMKMLGSTIEQIGGATQGALPWSAIQEDGSPFSLETHPAMITLRTGEFCRNVVMGMPRPDGSVTWLSVNCEPLFYPDEVKPYAVVIALSDITAHKKAAS